MIPILRPFAAAICALILLAATIAPAHGNAATPTQTPPAALPRSTPESQGVSSRRLLEFVDAASTSIDSLHSLMVIRHGRVVAEGWWRPYSAGARHELYSLSKSFTSTAIGIAAAEGLLDINDPVSRFFPDELPPNPSANLKAMRVRDLLAMSTGHQSESPVGAQQMTVRTFLAHPVPFKPGTHFLYNTPATFMLAAIVEKVSKQPLVDYLRPRLFDPLGIANPVWATNRDGIALGGYGLSVTTEDIARFGQLYLQKGRWRGKQLIPAAWVEAASARQTSNGSNPNSDWDQGYGYQFWRNRNNSYRGDGAFGQYCIVLPEHDAVIAITSGVRDMQGVLKLIWDQLLPAFEKRRLPKDTAAHAQLTDRLSRLTIPLPAGASTPASTPAAQIRGRAFQFPPNDQGIERVHIEQTAPNSTTLVLRVKGAEQRIPCTPGVWTPGRASLGTLADAPIAASGAWSDGSLLTTRVCFTETPYILTLKLRFDQATLLLDGEFNVMFGNARWPQLTGRAE